MLETAQIGQNDQNSEKINFKNFFENGVFGLRMSIKSAQNSSRSSNSSRMDSAAAAERLNPSFLAFRDKMSFAFLKFSERLCVVEKGQIVYNSKPPACKHPPMSSITPKIGNFYDAIWTAENYFLYEYSGLIFRKAADFTPPEPWYTIKLYSEWYNRQLRPEMSENAIFVNFGGRQIKAISVLKLNRKAGSCVGVYTEPSNSAIQDFKCFRKSNFFKKTKNDFLAVLTKSGVVTITQSVSGELSGSKFYFITSHQLELLQERSEIASTLSVCNSGNLALISTFGKGYQASRLFITEFDEIELKTVKILDMRNMGIGAHFESFELTYYYGDYIFGLGVSASRDSQLIVVFFDLVKRELKLHNRFSRVLERFRYPSRLSVVDGVGYCIDMKDNLVKIRIQ